MPVFNQVKEYVSKQLADFAIFPIIVLISAVLLRVFALMFVGDKSLLDSSSFVVFGHGFVFDIVFYGFIGMISLAIFALLKSASKRIAFVVLILWILVLCITDWALLTYFAQMNMPLDHALYAYPLNEIIYITTESVGLDLKLISSFLLIVLAFIIGFRFCKKSNQKTKAILSLLLLAPGVLYFIKQNPSPNKFTSDMTYFQTINRTSFLLEQSWRFKKNNSQVTEIDFREAVQSYHSANKDKDFVNKLYPLLHTSDTSDVLGEYFNFKDQSPNLVFIIVESLSGALSGDDAYLGSFTPFIDSLKTHSLYWKNFISTSERTFNALPSIFGSLPYGTEGFSKLINNDKAVHHHTLIKFLNDYGYSSRFFYGGWVGFDNMENFLLYQEMDFVLKKFPEKYLKIENDKDGFSWGYPDDMVFKRAIEVKDSLPAQAFLDIYLTMSSHHPYKPPRLEFYKEMFEKRMAILDLPNEEKEKLRHISDALATMLYTDESIRFLMNEYKKREGFDNTIFVITGDHRIGAGTPRNRIDKYHVPLLIYSPLLKESKVFGSVSSHANIAPTIANLLHQHFDIPMPGKVAWLGSQVDTAASFRNIQKLPFMRTNREISEYIDGKYFYSEGKLFEVLDGMELKQIEDEILADSLKRQLESFKLINRYICEKDLIISPEKLN